MKVIKELEFLSNSFIKVKVYNPILSRTLPDILEDLATLDLHVDKKWCIGLLNNSYAFFVVEYFRDDFDSGRFVTFKLEDNKDDSLL